MQESSSNIGVGGSPSGTYGKLSVFGGISIKDDNNAKLEIGRYSSGASNSYIKLGANSNSLRITDNADQYDILTLTNGGNLGLGVTPSAWGSTFKALQINPRVVLFSSTGSNDVVLGNNYYNNGTSNLYINTDFATAYAQSSGQHAWYTAASGTAGNAITFTQAMTLDASGRLLVGTISNVFGERLTVNNWITAGDLTRVALMGQDGTDVVMGAYSNHNLVLRTNNTARLTIASTGAATFSSSVTAGTLYINSTTGSERINVNGAIGFQNTSGTQKYHVQYSASGGLNFAETGVADGRLFIKDGGNVGIGTTNPTSLLHLFSSTAGVSQRIESTATNGEPSVNFYGKNSSGTVRSFAIKYDNTDIIRFGTSDAIPIRFETTDIERMRITSGGYVGINEQSPNSYLHVKGSLRLPIAIKTATYTLTADDYTVVFDLNGNATANLPDATTIPGRIYVIKINRTNVGDTLTIDPNGAQTIDGNATLDLLCQYAVTIQSDGTNWRVIGDYSFGLNCL
jgi:hypothetical protein